MRRLIFIFGTSPTALKLDMELRCPERTRSSVTLGAKNALPLLVICIGTQQLGIWLQYNQSPLPAPGQPVWPVPFGRLCAVHSWFPVLRVSFQHACPCTGRLL